MDYRIVEGAENIRPEEAARLLKTAYWAQSRTAQTVERSMENSECYGVYVDGEDRLAGFARVITDRATTYYLCDVIIDEGHRHKGLGKALVSHIVSLPAYSGLMGFLVTRDAHGLYKKYGFETVDGWFMSRLPGDRQ